MNREKLGWNALVTIASIGFAMAVRSLIEKSWNRVSDAPAPVNPADEDASWGQAILWAVVAGSAAGLARVVARRGSAAVWRRGVGEIPV